MPSDDRSASRRLHRAARGLRPVLAPYYMHNPRPGRERFGPGWYWVPAGGDERTPAYLGYNSIDAELALRALQAEAAEEEPAGAELVVLPRAVTDPLAVRRQAWADLAASAEAVPA